MNAKSMIALSGLAALAVCSGGAGSAARADRLPPTSCASGYHQDEQGNCQPNGGTSMLCQPGTHYMAFPNGNNYRCQLDGH